VGTIIKRTSIAIGRESDKVTAGSIKRAPRRHAGKPTQAQRWQRHLHRRCKVLLEMSSDGDSVSEDSRTESEPYETVEEFPFLLNLCFIFVGYFGWVQGLQNVSDFLAVNFPVSIQWYSCLIEQCHCSWSIVKGQLNSSIDKAPSHFAETENLQ
jgi:hypothetical protein